MAKGNGTQDFGEFSEVLADDRALDAIGRGERVENEDSPLYALLSSARREAEENIPAPPDLAEHLGPDFAVQDGVEGNNVVGISSGKERAGTIRRNARFAAAGGLSVTSMFIAGGVAAALAIGGLGYAAYNGTLPIRDTPQTVHAEGDASTAVDESSGAASTAEDTAGEAQEQQEEAPQQKPEEQEPAETSSAAPTEESAATTTLEQSQPLPDGQVLAEGEQPSGQGEGAIPMLGADGTEVPAPAATTVTTEEDDDEEEESGASAPSQPQPDAHGQLGPMIGHDENVATSQTDTTR